VPGAQVTRDDFLIALLVVGLIALGILFGVIAI